jgi:DNA-binding transcriptional LysR family regulator
VDFRRLQYFLRIAELGSLARASEVLRIAQPSLSRQMRLLEEELGLDLFARHRRGMQLTEGGRQLRSRIAGPLAQLDHALHDVRSLPSDLGGSIALGLPPTSVGALAAPLARRIEADPARIALRIVENSSNNLIEGLQRGELDLAIVHGLAGSFEPHAKDLLVERLMLVGPPGCTFSAGEPEEFEMMGELPLVLPSRPHGLRMAVEDCAARSAIKLNVKAQADSLQLLKEFVELGVGYTVLPTSAFTREAEAGRLKFAPLQNPTPTRQLVLAANPACPWPRAAQRVEALLRQELISQTGSRKWSGWLLFEAHEF